MCNFPYTNVTNTCITFAQSLNGEYYIYRSIFILISTILFTLTSIQLYRFWYHFKFSKYNDQLSLIILNELMTLMLLIQSIDPHGYMAILPFIIENLSANLSTTFGLIIIFRIVFSLITITSISDKRRKYNFMFLLISFVAIISTIIFSYLQVYVNRFLYRGIKLFTFSLTMFIFSVKLNLIIKKILTRIGNTNSKTSNITEKIRIKYTRHITIFNILIFSAIIYMFAAAIMSFTRINCCEKLVPNMHADKIIFPLCQFLSVILALSFTSEIKNKSPKTPIITLIKRKIITIKKNYTDNTEMINPV